MAEGEEYESFCLDEMYIMFAREPLAKESHKALPVFFSAFYPWLQLSEVTWRARQEDANRSPSLGGDFGRLRMLRSPHSSRPQKDSVGWPHF